MSCDVYTAKITCRLSFSLTCLSNQSKSRMTSKKWHMILMTHTSRRLFDQLCYNHCCKTVLLSRLHRLSIITSSVDMFITHSTVHQRQQRRMSFLLSFLIIMSSSWAKSNIKRFERQTSTLNQLNSKDKTATTHA